MINFEFSFDNLEQEYLAVLKNGYKIITCAEYVALKKSGLPAKTLVNRVDIDFSVKKAGELLRLFNKLGIKATFFVRLHAPEYNPFSFENYRILKDILNSEHEIGYHSEVIDQSKIWEEDATACLQRDIDIMDRMFNIKIKGVASHGGMTGWNNLDFWKDKNPSDFDLYYEGYDKQPAFNLFHESFYISDSEWTKWKCYNKGVLVRDDLRSPAGHLGDNHALIYLLIHPDTYFKNHIYE